jgi:hypothetical protein
VEPYGPYDHAPTVLAQEVLVVSADGADVVSSTTSPSLAPTPGSWRRRLVTRERYLVVMSQDGRVGS